MSYGLIREIGFRGRRGFVGSVFGVCGGGWGVSEY